MLPIPYFVTFVPICVFASLAVAAAVTQLIARIGTAPQPQPARPISARPSAARPSAQIYYFTPGKTPLRSYPERGSRFAMPQL